jgi:hypothetical protein
MDADQARARDGFDVNRAAPADPAVVKSDHAEAVLARFGNRHFCGTHQRVHAAVVAAVEHGRHRRFVHGMHAPPRLVQILVLKHIEQFW